MLLIDAGTGVRRLVEDPGLLDGAQSLDIVLTHSCIHLDRMYRAGDLIDLLRARTYPPYPSAYYVEGEQRTYVRVELLGESQLAALGMPESVRQALPSCDLDAQYRATDLLELLGIHDSSPSHFLHFGHESGPFFARGYVADEREFNTAASPEWTTNP